MLKLLLSLFYPIPVLENGVADLDAEKIYAYQLKLDRMNEIQLCKETGTTHQDFIYHNLTKADLSYQAMECFMNKLKTEGKILTV